MLAGCGSTPEPSPAPTPSSSSQTPVTSMTSSGGKESTSDTPTSERESSAHERESSQQETSVNPEDYMSVIAALSKQKYNHSIITIETSYNGDSLVSTFDITDNESNRRVEYSYEKFNTFDINNLAPLTETKQHFNGTITYSLTGEVIDSSGDAIEMDLSSINYAKMFANIGDFELYAWDIENRQIALSKVNEDIEMPFGLNDCQTLLILVKYTEDYRFDLISINGLYFDTTSVQVIIEF